VPIGPRDYLSAAKDMVAGRVHSAEANTITQQLRGWLLGHGFDGYGAPWAASLAQMVRLVSLIVTVWLALRWLIGRLPRDPVVGVLAVTALMAHAPMLFVFSTTYRYSVLAWDLSLLVLVVAIGRGLLTWSRPVEPARPAMVGGATA
jgi:hypothetical protein